MKKYYIKKWPWWKFWLKDIYGISKEYYIKDLSGKTIEGKIDAICDLRTKNGWNVPKGYFKEVKND